MSEEKPKEDTNYKLAEIGANVEKAESTPERTPEEEKKIRKAKLLDELTDVTNTPRQLPERRKPTAKIPEDGKIGEKFTVKLDKIYEKVNLKVYQGEKIENTGGGNDNAVHDSTEKNKDEISYDFYDPVPLQGKEINSLTAGKYFVQIHAWGSEAGDELEQEQVVNITT